MSSDASEPRRCEVSYSGRVRERILELADAARQRGDGAAFVAALPVLLPKRDAEEQT